MRGGQDMAKIVVMPQLGLTVTKGKIGAWLKGEGDMVRAGEELAVVESAGATNTIQARDDEAGYLLKILVSDGEVAATSAPLAVIGEKGEDIGALLQRSGILLNDGAAAASDAVSDQGEYQGIEAIPGKVSPMAAKLAKDLHVDVDVLYHGRRVMEADVKEAAMAKATEDTVKAAKKVTEDKTKVAPRRQTIAENMVASWQTSPVITYNHSVDVTAIKEMRRKLNESMQGAVRIQYNHILMYVVTKALQDFPDVNASFEDNMLTRHRYINMGLAVAKDDGLIIPNVKNCEQRTLTDLANEAARLVAAVRNEQIGVDDISGGTFTITNLGAYGITSFSPIINQPELAILGVCAIVDTPVRSVGGEIIFKPLMNLSLTADPRVIDGMMAAKFLDRIAELLENPWLLLA